MNVEHERHDAVRSLLAREKLLRPELTAQLEQPWRTNGLVVRCVFFGLTIVAVLAFYGFYHLIGIGAPGLVTAITCIALAEYLILRLQWSRTGVEESLWLCGAIAFITHLPSSGRPESMLVIAAAFAIPGARLRNPLFGAAAAICIAVYCETRFDLGVLAALVIATAALLALLRTWERPSTEWLFIALALTLPVAGITQAGEDWRVVTICLYAMFATLAFALGLKVRHHAFFLAAMIGITIAGATLGQMIARPIEQKLALCGALLLALAFAVSRALRDRTSGFVLTREQLTAIDDELQLAATLALKPETPVTEAPERGGGSFGGAGASGEF